MYQGQLLNFTIQLNRSHLNKKDVRKQMKYIKVITRLKNNLFKILRLLTE